MINFTKNMKITFLNGQNMTYNTALSQLVLFLNVRKPFLNRMNQILSLERF
jgi:hypothetical protein